MTPPQSSDSDPARFGLDWASLLKLGTVYSFQVLKCKLSQSRKSVESFDFKTGCYITQRNDPPGSAGAFPANETDCLQIGLNL